MLRSNFLKSTRRNLLRFAGMGAIGASIGGSRTLPASMTEQQEKNALARHSSSVEILPSPTQRSVMEKSLSRAGAVGDGITIDTEAIQEAISEVERNTRFETQGSDTPFLGDGEIVWPQGLFLVDDAIRITRSLRLIGEGQAEYSSGARIQQQSPGKDLFRIEPIAQGCSVGFHNMVLRANGGGRTGGALLRVIRDAGQCNSIRIKDVVFATPQSYAIDITQADDIVISNCLFDVSAVDCIRAGIDGESSKVTNLRIADSYLFSIAGECIILGNVDGVIIQGNHSFSEKSSRTFVKLMGYNTKCRNIVVRANTIHNMDCLVDASSVDGLVVDSNVGDGLGAGVLPRRALVHCAGRCEGIVVTGNRLKGEATEGFYDDTDAEVTEAVIVGNVFGATGVDKMALRTGNTRGRIGDNYISGAVRHGVGYRWQTRNAALVASIVPAHQTIVVDLPVKGSMEGDHVVADMVKLPVPDGIIMTASAANDMVRIRYANLTNRPIAIPSHDLSLLVTR